MDRPYLGLDTADPESLRVALAQLPPIEREVLDLWDAGVRDPVIGRRLGIRATGYRIQRAMWRLRFFLTDGSLFTAGDLEEELFPRIERHDYRAVIYGTWQTSSLSMPARMLGRRNGPILAQLKVALTLVDSLPNEYDRFKVGLRSMSQSWGVRLLRPYRSFYECVLCTLPTHAEEPPLKCPGCSSTGTMRLIDKSRLDELGGATGRAVRARASKSASTAKRRVRTIVETLG